MVGTILARRAQFHQANLIAHLTPMDPAYNGMLSGTAQILMSKGSDPVQAMQQLHGLLYGMVQQQAMMKAFIDNFWLLGVIFLAVIPLMFLTKTIQKLSEAGNFACSRLSARLLAGQFPPGTAVLASTRWPGVPFPKS